MQPESPANSPKPANARQRARVELWQTEVDSQGQHTVGRVVDPAGAIDPSGGRKDALDSFLERKLREGFEIETHTNTHAIVAQRDQRRSFLSRLRGRGAANRFVVSVDEHGQVTMVPAEPKRR